MGQKVNPIGLRLGINKTWDSRWFDAKGYTNKFLEDLKIRDFLFTRLKAAQLSKVLIERRAQKISVTIYAAKPGVIIGKQGVDIEKLKTSLSSMTQSEISLNIFDVRKAETDAKLVAENIAQQLEKRASFRKVIKRARQDAMKMGALGIRILVSGRLGGAEIARKEEVRIGRVPLHTFRADIDYSRAEAFTTYGVCGIKVWVYKGNILENDPSASHKRNYTTSQR